MKEVATVDLEDSSITSLSMHNSSNYSPIGTGKQSTNKNQVPEIISI